MDNKYNDYSEQTFIYDYPYTWNKRNKEYLEKRADRKIQKGALKLRDALIEENNELLDI